MVSLELRPLSTGEILDDALTLLRRQFALVVGIAVACEGIPTALGIFLDLTGGPVESPGLGLLNQLLTVVGSVLVTGASVRVVSEAYLGRTAVFGDAMRFAGSRFGSVFGATFMSGVLTILATFALIIPGIVVACGYSVASQAAALEAGSSSDALRRSWALTKGFRWKAFALWIVAVAFPVVVLLGAGVLGGVLAELAGGLDAVLVVLTSLVLLLIYPVISFVFTVFYYDLRVRKEGFDLEVLSQQLELASTGSQ
jgi:hypothetical protein